MQFKTTLKELALFVEREYKGDDDIGYIFRELKDVMSPYLSSPQE